MIPTVNSYFSGAGLLDIGLLESGVNIGAAFELDSDACKTYRFNLGEHIKQRDLCEELVKGQGDCDAMCFTYPCSHYSAIADICGTRNGDELFLHALRHLAIARPAFYAVENVKGMLAFKVVMEAMTKLPDYYVQVFCPIKTEYWLPQRRDRLIIIGTHRNFAITEPDNCRSINLSDILENEPNIDSIPDCVYQRMNGKYRDKPIVSDPDNNDIAPTCVAHYSKDKSTRLVKDVRYPMNVRPYTVREYARLQGIPDWFKFPVSDTSAYKQIGNGVPVPMGEWIGKQMIRYFR